MADAGLTSCRYRSWLDSYSFSRSSATVYSSTVCTTFTVSAPTAFPSDRELMLHSRFLTTVLHFGDPIFPLLTIGWEVAINYVCIACMIFAVQVYFAHRVWTASRHSIWVLLVFGSLTLFTLLAGIIAAALSLQAGSSANVRAEVLTHFAAGSPPWRWAVIFTLWLVIVATTDLILCGCLTWQLSRMKSRESLRSRVTPVFVSCH